MGLILTVGLAALAAAVCLYAVSAPQGGRFWWPLAVLIMALVLAGRLADGVWSSSVLLDLAELAAVALVWSDPGQGARKAAKLYFWSIVPAIFCTLLALALGGQTGVPPGPMTEKLIVCMTVIGFALKLGLIPFYFWLPAVAASAAPMTVALIVAVVDIATFGELAALRTASPWIFEGYAPVWMVVALVSMVGGAVLALAQTELRRMLAFSTIADLGFLLLGLIAGGAGIEGAWLGALSHAISKTVMFGAVGLAERKIGRTVTLDTGGLVARLPVAGGAFIAAALSFIGVPPGFGFVAYWRIYAAATAFGGPALIAVLLAVAALDLLCYARVIHRCWYGPAEPTDVAVPPGRMAGLAPGVLALFAVFAVLFGCAPDLLTGPMAPQLLTMVR